MTLPRILSIAFGLLAACPMIADTVLTPPFQVVAVPDVPEPNAPPDFFLLSAANTVPTGINNNGQIVGAYRSLPYPNVEGAGPFGTFGFLDSNGSYTAYYSGSADGNYCTGFYGPSSCGNNLYPTGINDSGTMVGNFPGDQFGDISGFSAQGLYTFCQCKPLWLSVSSIVYPGVQPGSGQTLVTGVNDSGAMVGYYENASDRFAGGFLFNGGVFTPLSFNPVAINDLGQILGVDSSGDTVIDTNGNIQSLGILPFAPTGFNDDGLIAGGDYLYYYPRSSLIQVDLPGQSGVQINAINDLGQFVGTANGSNGQFGFEAATPEPYAGLPLLAGVCAIALLRLRARRRSRELEASLGS
jgi:hypothetical protein